MDLTGVMLLIFALFILDIQKLKFKEIDEFAISQKIEMLKEIQADKL